MFLNLTQKNLSDIWITEAWEKIQNPLGHLPPLIVFSFNVFRLNTHVSWTVDGNSSKQRNDIMNCRTKWASLNPNECMRYRTPSVVRYWLEQVKNRIRTYVYNQNSVAEPRDSIGSPFFKRLETGFKREKIIIGQF